MVFQTSRSALAILALAGCSTCSPRRDRTDPLSDGPSDGAIYQGTQPNLSGQYDLRRLNGAWAWIEGVPRPTVLLLHDDTSVFPDRVPVPLELPGPGNVSSLVGAGDILLFVHRTLTGAELAVSNAPFTSARVVWSPGGSFGSLSADPEHPTHVVFDHSSNADELCASGSAIYYFDLSTADTMPPRALTNNSITHIGPKIQDDRVAYLDFS